MKIAFLSAFPPYDGSLVSGNMALYRSLMEDHEVSLYNFSLLYPEILFPGVENTILSNKYIDEVNSQRVLNTFNPASYYSAAAAIREFEPNVFITRSWMPYVSFAIGSVANILGKVSAGGYINHKILDSFEKRKAAEYKIYRIGIIDTFASELQQRRHEKNSKLYVDNHDAFITFSKKTTEELLAINPNSIFAELPFPVLARSEIQIKKDIAQRILNIPEDKKVLLYMDNISEHKKIESLIEMIKKLDDSYYLLLVGSSVSGYNHYKRLIEKNGVEKKVGLYIRELNENEIPIYFAASDAIIIPVNSSTQLDILSYNLPVITSKSTDISDVIEKYKLGVVVEDMLESNETSSEITKYFDVHNTNIINNTSEDLILADNNSSSKFLANKMNYNSIASWDNVASAVYDLVDRLIGEGDLSIYM